MIAGQVYYQSMRTNWQVSTLHREKASYSNYAYPLIRPCPCAIRHKVEVYTVDTRQYTINIKSHILSRVCYKQKGWNDLLVVWGQYVRRTRSTKSTTNALLLSSQTITVQWKQEEEKEDKEEEVKRSTGRNYRQRTRLKFCIDYEYSYIALSIMERVENEKEKKMIGVYICDYCITRA